MSTITAISSPIGAGGIGIVRVSGEEALNIADAIFSFAKTNCDESDNQSNNLDCFKSTSNVSDKQSNDHDCFKSTSNESDRQINDQDCFKSTSNVSDKQSNNLACIKSTSDESETHTNKYVFDKSICEENEQQKIEKSKENKKNNWVPLKMHFGTFHTEDFCDKGYAVYFPPKKAFTGESTVEFYLHGGIRIMSGAIDEILSHGAVLAEKGEFTKRAFLSGRMSLADSEGVIDMINAESAAGLRAAYRLMDGEVSKKIETILTSLVTVMSTLEATLDYPDEMEDEVLPLLPKELGEIEHEIQKLLDSSKRGRMAKHGITAVLAGETNAGKSSLMNALLGQERAIVTAIAGTTRDTITESFECDDVKINLIDTAGIRESIDEVETVGIARAKRAIEGADVVIHVIDTTQKETTEWDFGNKLVFTVLNKCDLTSFKCPRMAHTFAVSSQTGENVQNLSKAIAALYRNGELEGGEVITSERHISSLYSAKEAIRSAICSLKDTIDCTLIDLRKAYNSLGEITGKTATEDIVKRIFEKFCVGK